MRGTAPLETTVTFFLLFVFAFFFFLVNIDFFPIRLTSAKNIALFCSYPHVEREEFATPRLFSRLIFSALFSE